MIKKISDNVFGIFPIRHKKLEKSTSRKERVGVMKKHRLFGIVYIVSFFVYPLLFALLDRVSMIALMALGALALGYEAYYVLVLRKREKVGGSKALLEGFTAAAGALSVIIAEMYAAFFVMGMSTMNIKTGEMDLVFGFDIFKVHGADMAMHIFFIAAFAVCMAFALYQVLSGRKSRKASSVSIKKRHIATA